MKRVMNYVLRYKPLLIIPSISMLLVIVACMFEPYFQKLFIDRVISNGERNLITYLIGGIIVINIVKSVFGYIKEYLFDYLSVKVTKDLKEDLFNHIQKLPFKYFDTMNTGEIMSRMGEDIDNIWQTISYGLRLFFENALYFVFSTVILLYLNWKLALACLVILLPISFIALKLEKKMLNSYEEISDQGAVINTTAQENIAGVRLVKAFGREKHEILKFLKINKQNYKLNIEQSKIIANFFPPIELLTNISLVIMVALGGIFVIRKEISLGTLVAFSGYIWNLIWPMRMLGWLINLISQNNASANKIFKIMNIEPEVKDAENAVSLPSIEGNIKFKNVSFKYREEEILTSVDLDIPAGSTVALMGTTGSGKTSIINLLGRYYDVSQGEVSIDGVDVRNLKLDNLRNAISIVPQDVFLFSDTIEENIRFGNRNASDKELIEAADLACASNFISGLKDGYATVVGERGLGLSGGQKQRISIARALARKAPILILDDATSALDMETEFQLLKNLSTLTHKSTVFIIAHRISAVKNADIILFLDNGNVLEKGTHEELLELKGKYYEVYKEQFKDFETLSQEVIA